jgi:uncharacterized membrane protein YfhO
MTYKYSYPYLFINYINFLGACGVLDAKNEDQTRWADGVRRSALLQVLAGVRYFLFQGDWRAFPILEKNYAEIARFGNVTVLESRFAIPMGVAYDSYITQSDFEKLNSVRKRVALLKAIMIPDKLAADFPAMSRVSPDDVPLFMTDSDELAIDVGADAEKLRANNLRISSFSNGHIDGEIHAKIKQLIFFSFPYDEGWEATVDGQAVDMVMVDGGLSAVIVEPGKNVISLRYFPPYIKTGLLLTLIGLLIFAALFFRNKGQQPSAKGLAGAT